MEKETKTVEELAADEIAAMTPAKSPKGISDEEIAGKVRAGLTRDQAIEVIGFQRDHDAAIAAAAKAEKKSK